MDELKQAVQDALFAFHRVPAASLKHAYGTGLTEVSHTLDVVGLFDFHDSVAHLPWPAQCRTITERCGPTQHSIVLMALAWLTYDGWVRYLQEHKHAPVNVQHYLLDGMQADDIRSVLAKEY